MNLTETFAVLKPGMGLDTLPGTDTVFEDMESAYGGFSGHVLVTTFRFDEDWPTWERHPNGDELVTLISGRAEMILRTANGDQSVELTQPGDFIVVPRDTWHTARISEPTMMVFVTPGEGTENVEQPPG